MTDINNIFAKNLNIVQPNDSNIGQGYVFSMDENQTLRLASYNPTDRTTLAPIMHFSLSNHVGIGTSNPEYDLHVVGDAKVTGSIFNTSDIRFKKDLVSIPDALNKVANITGYTYIRTDMPFLSQRQAGVIAQEVQPILPEAVHQDPQTGSLSVSYDSLIPLLIESIKEIKKELDHIKDVVSSTLEITP